MRAARAWLRPATTGNGGEGAESGDRASGGGRQAEQRRGDPDRTRPLDDRKHLITKDGRQDPSAGVEHQALDSIPRSP